MNFLHAFRSIVGSSCPRDVFGGSVFCDNAPRSSSFRLRRDMSGKVSPMVASIMLGVGLVALFISIRNNPNAFREGDDISHAEIVRADAERKASLSAKIGGKSLERVARETSYDKAVERYYLTATRRWSGGFNNPNFFSAIDMYVDGFTLREFRGRLEFPVDDSEIKKGEYVTKILLEVSPTNTRIMGDYVDTDEVVEATNRKKRQLWNLKDEFVRGKARVYLSDDGEPSRFLADAKIIFRIKDDWGKSVEGEMWIEKGTWAPAKKNRGYGLKTDRDGNIDLYFHHQFYLNRMSDENS